MSRLLGVVLLAVVAVALGASPALANNQWGSYHWAYASLTQDPSVSTDDFTVKLGDNVSSAWDGFLATAAGDWSDSMVLNTPVVTGSTDPRRCKPSTGVQVCNAKYGYNGWLGLAQIWVSGSHIQKAVAKMNDSYFTLATYNNPNAKLHVLCQEVGHALGLDHQHTGDVGGGVSCMNDTAGLSDPLYAGPNQHDYDQLATIYTSHADTTTTSSASLKGNGQGNGETLFVEDLGNGKKLFTWVFWADRRTAHGPPF